MSDKEAETGTEAKITDDFARIYTLNFLYDTKPNIDIEALIAELTPVLGEISHQVNSAELNALYLLDHCVNYADDTNMPSQIVLFGVEEIGETSFANEIQQSWQFPEAAEVAENAKYKLMITDMMAAGLDVQKRVHILAHVMHAIAKHTNCTAIVNSHSQQLLNPKNLKPAEEPLLGFINVRLYDAGEQGMVMDSLGLGALGLGDIQCHFQELDINDVANALYNILLYIYNEQPEFEIGQTIQGAAEQKWKINFEMSLVEPTRPVMDLEPEGKHAAGRRD